MSESSNQSLIGIWLGDYFAKSSELSFPSGAVLLTDGDKIVGRVEPESTLDELVAYALALATDVPSEPNPNAPMVARDDREPTMREIKVMFGVRLLQAFAEAQRQDGASPRKAHPANVNLLRG